MKNYIYIFLKGHGIFKRPMVVVCKKDQGQKCNFDMVLLKDVSLPH